MLFLVVKESRNTLKVMDLTDTKSDSDEIQEIQGGGNTRSPPAKKRKRVPQIAPAKRWCFTLNNWKDPDCDVLGQSSATDVPVLIYQSEVGENDTPHLQGYFEFKTKKRPVGYWSPLFKHKRTHYAVAKGTREQNVEYCSKADTHDGRVRYTRGIPPPLQKMDREDMRENQLAIADDYIIPENAKFGREIHWYWEEEGGWGKSILCKYMVDQMGAILLGGANKDALYGIAGMVKEHGFCPPIVIFDIPRVNKGGISYQTLEYIKNGCFFNSKYESGMVRFNSPHIIVFSNQEPEYDKLSSDRWSVRELKKRSVEQDRSKSLESES